MITVITGPPCSGKSTYIRAHARPGDIIIDFDSIARALGSPVHHDHDTAICEMAAAAWAGAVRAALRVHHQRKIWIIDSRPLPRREEDYRTAGARVIALGADVAELHRRADTDGSAVAYRHRRIDEFLAGNHPRADQQARPATSW